jgi:hypothetical protein
MFVIFFVSSVCVFLCVWLLWIKQGCCLFANHIGHNVIRNEEKKTWNVEQEVTFEKKYIMRCSSAERFAINRCWGWVPWDDAILVSAGKLMKLWDSLSELRSSLCERWLKRTVLRPVLLPVKSVQFYPPGMIAHRKIAQCNWQCIGAYDWFGILTVQYESCPTPSNGCSVYPTNIMSLPVRQLITQNLVYSANCLNCTITERLLQL